MLAAPLAAAVACLEDHLRSISSIEPAQLAPGHRISYPALSAVVTACHIQTAWAADGAAWDGTCSSATFGSFWAPVAEAIHAGYDSFILLLACIWLVSMHDST